MGACEIAVKDLRVILQDKGALFTLLALPVVIIAIFGASTGQMLSAQEQTKFVKVGVVDEDQVAVSEHVIRDLSAIGGLKVEKLHNRDDARLQLQEGRCSVVVILGKDFENRVNDLDLADVFDTEHGKLAEGLSALDMHVESGAEFAGVAELVQYVV